MATLVHEQTRLTETEIASGVARAYVAYIKTAKALPVYADEKNPEREQFAQAVQRLGAAFAPSLASTSRLFDEAEGIETALGTTYPPSLARLVQALEDVFVFFWSVKSADDLSEIARTLPPSQAIVETFDSPVRNWLRERVDEPLEG